MKTLFTMLSAAVLVTACSPRSASPGADTVGREAEMSNHGGMATSLDPGDPDRSFAASMIPHHRDAVRMAEAELRLGRDPKLRALAAKIIEDQQREIAQLERWLAKPRQEASKQ